MIRTLIIDDEPPARARMKRLLESVADCVLVGEAASGSQALEMIPRTQPDLLLLDISMPGMDGMALARTLRSMDRPPAIVFCTAWPDQALEAFDCDALDYLVKPIRKERLQTAIGKVRRLLEQQPVDAGPQYFLRSTVGGKTTMVSLDAVICLVAEDKYTTVFYTGGKTVINDSLVDLEKRFPEQLMRVHRKALVARRMIRGLDSVGGGSARIVLEGTEFKPEVSRRKLAAIRKYLRDMG
jgi:two-component system response regulator AlgR